MIPGTVTHERFHSEQVLGMHVHKNGRRFQLFRGSVVGSKRHRIFFRHNHKSYAVSLPDYKADWTAVPRAVNRHPCKPRLKLS